MKVAVLLDSTTPFPQRDMGFAKIVADGTASGLTGIAASQRVITQFATYNSIYVDLVSETMKEAQRDIDDLEKRFTDFCEKQGLRHEWVCIHGLVENEWQYLSPYIDLAIVPPALSVAKLATLGVTGMLQLPETADIPDFTGRCLIAWDGSPHAARALRAALPLLPRFKTVDVVMVNPERREDCFDIGVYLAAHGIAATVISEPSGGEAVADVILYQAAAVDLLVLGAYGHSPIMEHIFGGVTEGVSKQARCALLFAH